MELREWRESKNWSQAKLAKEISKHLPKPVAQGHVYSWEQGKMPGANIGEIISKMSRGAVKWS